VGSSVVARTAGLPLIARPVGTGASSLDVQPCTPPEQLPAAQSDVETLRGERLSGGMLQDLDRVAQQLKDAACGLSAAACPMSQPSLDSNGGTSSTPRLGLAERPVRSPSPRMGGALMPAVARLTSCPAPVHCPAIAPAPHHITGTLAGHDKSSMLSTSSGRETPMPNPAPRHLNAMMTMSPTPIRTSLGRSHLPSAEQAPNPMSMFGTVEGVASSDVSSMRRLEACPPHLTKSTSSPEVQRFHHACLAPRAASPPQRALPRG